MGTLLACEAIEKYYGSDGERFKALDRVSLRAAEGEFLSVMGPSGSGKSTLLYALSGMDAVDAGKVSFGGRDLAGMGERELADLRRGGMGFVFQQPTFLRSLSILDNIVLPALNRDRGGKAALFGRARELMARAGIAGLEDRAISKVSGGQLQRAGICRALMGAPRIVFGDEPTGALNSASAREIMELLSSINKDGTALLLVTHDAAVAAWSSRVLFMRDGSAVSELRLGPAELGDLDGRTQAVRARLRELGM